MIYMAAVQPLPPANAQPHLPRWKLTGILRRDRKAVGNFYWEEGSAVKWISYINFTAVKHGVIYPSV